MKEMKPLTKVILMIAALTVVFSFFAPAILTQSSGEGGIDFSQSGPIGDTIGGIMNPFVALAGVLLTFVAFYIQYRANQQQKESFRKELDAQATQYLKNKFENQFYQMLNIHKDNVGTIEVMRKVILSEGAVNEHRISGRKAFDYMLGELEIAINLAKVCFPEETANTWLNKGYGLFFRGVGKEPTQKHPFFEKAYDIKHKYRGQRYSSLQAILSYHFNQDMDRLNPVPEFDLFEGQSKQLSHYYRHLFQTVKFITSQDEKLISYEEKRNYLRILRAQLSNSEQAHLFYNWFSRFGRQWEDSNNKFFTDYRMVHNIYKDLIVEDINIETIFDLNGNFRKEKGRNIDPLFEFEDWAE